MHLLKACDCSLEKYCSIPFVLDEVQEGMVDEEVYTVTPTFFSKEASSCCSPSTLWHKTGCKPPGSYSTDYAQIIQFQHFCQLIFSHKLLTDQSLHPCSALESCEQLENSAHKLVDQNNKKAPTFSFTLIFALCTASESCRGPSAMPLRSALEVKTSFTPNS